MSFVFNNIGYYQQYEGDLDRLMDNKFFQDKKDVLVLSAVLSFKEITRDTVDNTKLKVTKKLNNVKFDEYAAIIYGIAIAHSKDAAVVTDEKKVVEIFNKYANLGFEKLYKIITDTNGSAISNLEALIANPDNFIIDSNKFSSYFYLMD